MPVGDLGIWPNTVEIGGRKAGWQKEEEWSIDNEEEKEILNTQTI